MEADVHGRDFNFYWDKVILPQVEASIREGYITQEDWNLVMGNLHHIRKLRYAITPLTDYFQFINAKSDAYKTEDMNNFGNLFKLFAIMTKSLLAFSLDPTQPDDLEFRFVNGNHRDIIGHNQYGPAMEYLNDQLKLSTSDIVLTDGKIMLAAKDNKLPPRIDIYEDSVSGRRTLTLKLLGLTGHLI